MATYTKTGFGRLDDFGARNFSGASYSKSGAGILGLPWLVGAARIYAKSGYGRLDDFGNRPTQNFVFAKAGRGVAALSGYGYKANNIYIKTGLRTYWWPEPPSMEDWLGVRPKGSGFAGKNIKTPPQGSGVAGGKGAGVSVALWAKRGAGVANGVGKGARTGTGTRGAIIKSGWASVHPFTGAFSSIKGFRGVVPVAIGVYDDVAVAGVTLMVGGVPFGDELTDNLDNKLLNGAFDTDITGWTTTGSASIARTTATVRYGSGAMQVNGNAGGAGAISTGGNPWRGGHGYRVGMWVFGAGGGTARIGVFRPSTGTQIASRTVGLTASWQRVFLDVAIPADEVYQVQLLANAGAASFVVDGVSVIEHALFQLNTSYFLNGFYDVGGRVRDGAGRVSATATQRVRFNNVAQPLPTLSVEIAFDSAPRDTVQTWTDVTSDFLEGSWGHGRSTVLDRTEAGQLSLTLDNTARAYDNLNQNSPYFGKVVVGKRIRTSAIYNGWRYPRYEGSITEYQPVWMAGGRSAQIQIQAVDDSTPLSRLKISTTRAHHLSEQFGTPDVFSRVGGGNDITFTIVDPGVESDFEIDVTTTSRYARDTGSDDESAPFIPNPSELQISERNIVVILEHNGVSVTTTLQQMVDALNAHADAGQIIEATIPFFDVGTSLATGFNKVSLTGGERKQEPTGSRINWVLDQIDLPESRRQLDAGTVEVVQTELDREVALDHAQLVATTELGQLFFNGDGEAVFHDTNRRRYSSLKQTYSDSPTTSAGVHQYIAGTPTQGTELIYNDIQVAAPKLVAVRVADSVSADAFWPSSFDHQTLLVSTEEMEERGLMLLTRYKDPVEQLKQMRLEPLREAVGYDDVTAWPHALDLEVSDRLHVYRNPPGGGQLMYESFVESVRDDVRSGREISWNVTIGMSVAFTTSDAGSSTGGIVGVNPWKLEDATYGILDQTTRLG